MQKIDVYKNGEFERIIDVISVICQANGVLEIIKEDETIMFQKEEYDWFCIL